MNASGKAQQVYEQITDHLSRIFAEHGMLDTGCLSVGLRSDDVVINGFWAEIEDCAAGIQYDILTTQGERLGEGEIPLHKVPWKYWSSLQESPHIMDIVAMALAKNFPNGGTINNVLTTRVGNEALYTPLRGTQEFGCLSEKALNRPSPGLQVRVQYPNLPALHRHHYKPSNIQN